MENLRELYIVSVHTRFNWKKPGTYISALNRIFTRDQRDSSVKPFLKNGFNHTSLLELYEDDSMFIVEATGKGIARINFKTWKEEDKIIRIWTTKAKTKYDREKAELLLDIFVELKQGYDYKALLWYQLIFAIGRRINRLLKTNIRWVGYTDAGKAGRKWYCSEFAAYMWTKLTGCFRYWYQKNPNKLDRDCKEYFKQIYLGEANELTIQDLLKWR